MRPLLTLLFLILPLLTSAQQTRNAAFQRYIDQYKTLAVEQMRRYSIPASITLAQGLLESGAGQSPLAQKSNNHFGIKRGSDWTGPTVTHNDDRHGEHFRKYSTVAESYEDHSKFLHRSRYDRLYRLSILDYKGWARGLKACGYATSPTYADRLIGIIELYNLQALDEDPNSPRYIPEPYQYEEVHLNYHAIQTNNDVTCIIAREGDTWASLAKELRISQSKLQKYNESESDADIRPGIFIYLAKKQSKGPKEMKGKWHKITASDSMYSIAQLYGIQLASLYKLNYKDADYEPAVGDLLRVR